MTPERGQASTPQKQHLGANGPNLDPGPRPSTRPVKHPKIVGNQYARILICDQTSKTNLIKLTSKYRNSVAEESSIS